MSLNKSQWLLNGLDYLFSRSAVQHIKSQKILLSSDLDGLKDKRAKREKLWDQCQLNLETLRARKIVLESELSYVSYETWGCGKSMEEEDTNRCL
jgi:hypothetical protein